MSLFSFIGSMFGPATTLIDEIVTTEEERLTLKAKLAEIEAKVSVKMMELQQAVIESNAKVAAAEQEHGNWLSKSWRPICSLGMMGILVAMGFGIIEYKELMVQIAGGFLGIYAIGRSVEKKNK